MDLKQCLVQLCDIKLEIKEVKAKISKLEQRCKELVYDSVESTSKEFPIIRTHAKIFGNDKKLIDKLEYYKNILEERESKLIDVEIKTEEYIDKLPTSRLRRIFSYRYLEQCSWIKIAHLMGGTATADSLRMEHDRFLNKNELCSFCSQK